MLSQFEFEENKPQQNAGERLLSAIEEQTRWLRWIFWLLAVTLIIIPVAAIVLSLVIH